MDLENPISSAIRTRLSQFPIGSTGRSGRQKRASCSGIHFALDMGLYKSFKMPWEGHSLQFRWEVFNVTNTQRFDGVTIADSEFGFDPFLGGNPSQTSVNSLQLKLL
jgi:hypothetical protein